MNHEEIISKLQDENKTIVETLEVLKANHEDTLKRENDCKEHLKNQLQAYTSKLDAVKEANEVLENNNKILVDEVKYLELNNKSQKAITKRLNTAISEVRLKLKTEKK